jgi:hypothetical protein
MPGTTCEACRLVLDPVLVEQGDTMHLFCADLRAQAARVIAGEQDRVSRIEGPPPFPAATGGLTSAQVGQQIGRELVAALKGHADNRPRSLQRVIGPSEVGSPCRRRLAYKLLGAEAVNTSDPWASWVGTQIHEGMEVVMTLANAGEPDIRWITETRVDVADDLAGSADLIDRKLLAVIDHKAVGKTSFDAARRHGPSDQYRIQAQLYAHGLRRMGTPIEHVVIVYWPRTGFKAEPHIWAAPYDEQTALDALAALSALRALVDAAGWQALPMLPAVEAHCTFCPFWAPGSTDLGRGCPGASTLADRQQRDPIHELIA